jgi:signal transduction histidine kinase
MNWGSVRVRLTLWNVSVLALVLFGFAAALTYSVRVSQAEYVDRDLRDRAHAIARRWGGPPPPPPGPRRPTPTISRSSTDAERRGYFRRPRFLNREGQSMFALDEHPWDPDAFILALAGHELYTTLWIEGEQIRTFSVPLWNVDEIEGVLQVAHPLTEQNRLNAGLLRTLLTLIPVALLVAGLGGAFLTERALRPVRHISHTAAQIGAEDLSRRIQVHGNDEMAELGRTFNGMIGRLEDAFRHLEEAYDQQRRFVGDASHELRTPLTTIKANTSLALSGPPDLEGYREALQAADHAADTMTRIVQDLLLLARSDAGRLDLHLQPVLLAPLLERAMAGARVPDGPAVYLDRPEEPLAVRAEEHHLLRLFVNLLENAIRHTPPEGEVRLSAAPAGPNAVEVSVSDTGEGIAAEHLPHVMERFYRVDASRTRSGHALGGGTGLGLAICRSIAEAHGGTLQIRSEEGKGTTVTVRLQAAEAPVADTIPAGLA